MHEHDSAVSVEQRLSQQLHGLIDLTALLTKRLLATEERLLALETAPQAEPVDDRHHLEQLLEEGQQQVRHLHLLLNPEPEASVVEMDQPEEGFEAPLAEHESFIDDQQHHPEDESMADDDDDSQMPLLSA